jgi:hypothetical protein
MNVRTNAGAARCRAASVLLNLSVLAAWTLWTSPSGFAQEPGSGDGAIRSAAESTAADTTESPKRYDAFRPLSSIKASIAPKLVDEEGGALPLPENLAQVEMARLGKLHHVFGYTRPWALSGYCWEGSGFYHWPLYFEETALERFGHEVPLIQPVVTAAHFYATLPVLPYKIGAQYPWDCLYDLGYERPGNCVPYEWELPPPSARGGIFAGGIITGLIYAIP